MVAMWDDGEFYNGIDATGAARSASRTRKQAWFDSFPVLDPGGRRAYRRFAWGDLADVSMIDVRAYRDPAIDEHRLHRRRRGQRAGTHHARAPSSTTGSPSGLAASTAAWRIVGNPYNISPWRLVNLEFLRAFRPDLPPNSGIYAPNEAWDDYMQERRDLLQFLVDAGVTDTVFTSGHTHTAIVAELRADFDRPSTPGRRVRLLHRLADRGPRPPQGVPRGPPRRRRRGRAACGGAVRARARTAPTCAT